MYSSEQNPEVSEFPILTNKSSVWPVYTLKHHELPNRPFATSDHVVQNPPCWRASSLLFLRWDIKTKRPEPVKLDLPLF